MSHSYEYSYLNNTYSHSIALTMLLNFGQPTISVDYILGNRREQAKLT